MFTHLFRSIVRNIVRDPWLPVMTWLGLSIAFFCSFTALIYVFNELSYDRVHTGRDRIYRVIRFDEPVSAHFAGSPWPVYTIARDEIPQVEKAALMGFMRDFRIMDNEGNQLDRRFRVNFATPEIFEILSFDLVHGDKSALFGSPDELVISRSVAENLFPGRVNPVGEQVRVIINNQEEVFRISGVFIDWPETVTFRIDILCHPNHALNAFLLPGNPGIETDWKSAPFSVFVLLNENSGKEEAEQVINSLSPYDQDELPVKYSLHSLKDFYYGSSHIANMHHHKTGSRSTLWLLAGTALLILFIAVTNSILFLIARFSSRTREMGIRKVAGADTADIVKLPAGESLLVSFAALLTAVMLIELFLPNISSYFRNGIYYHTLKNYNYLAAFALLSFLVAMLAGWAGGRSYSARNPALLLRGESRNRRTARFGTRKILLSMQIGILIAMLSASGFIVNQLNFLRNADTGIDKDRVLKVMLNPQSIPAYASLKEELLHIPGVAMVSGAFEAPPGFGRIISEIASPDDPEIRVVANQLVVDNLFFESFGINLYEGRFFSEKYPSDPNESVILNRTAVAGLGLLDPVGKLLGDKTIIGVCEDFNLTSLHTRVQPVFFSMVSPAHIRELIIRFDPEKTGQVVSGINALWDRFSFSTPPHITFPGQTIDFFYREEEALFNMIVRLTVIAGLISVFGLTGLAVFNARRRTREIGIRKVNGATTFDIVRLWLKEYLALVFIGLLSAIPVVSYLVHNWLQNYPYRISFSWWIFPLAGTAAALIVWISTSIQTYRAASQNPVKLLRHE